MMQHDMPMGMTGPLGIPMSREGSGTSWLPDSTPMHALHAMRGDWRFMLHGNVFVQYINEGGDRGDDQIGSVNWAMGMARRELAGGNLSLRAMLSAEPSTVGRCGYPDLLATGELCRGRPLRDRQHPHDLFMELAAGYERALSDAFAFQLYGAPVGEPALRPVAYPHRPSAMAGPIAPITHHWVDATHISFGVVTAALYGRQWKLDGSVFNGREPDEERFDFDFGRLDSYSGRLTWLPNARWALQGSAGRLTEAEAGRNGGERHDVTRTTASAIHSGRLGMTGAWTTTAVWGRNAEGGDATHGILVETDLMPNERHTVFGRAEVAQKKGEDLALDEEGAGSELLERRFTVGTVSAGYVRQPVAAGAFVPGIGARVSLSFVPRTLEPFYGSRATPGFAVFVSVRPRRMGGEMQMNGMRPMPH